MDRPLLTVISAAFALSALFLNACSSDVGFSTDSRQVLSFPSEAISMDSVMSGMVSSSVLFMVYNNNDCAIRFDALLKGGSGSVFEMIADGMNGPAALGLEVDAHDSTVFVLRANPEYRDDAPSTGYSDSIQFILENGPVQYLPVTVTSVNAKKLSAYRVQGTEHLESGKSYLIMDSLYVPEGAVLEIGPGTRLFFHSGAGLVADGCVVAKGRPDSLILFQGYRLDSSIPGLPYDLLDGQWRGIRLGKNSFGNRFECCHIHGAGYGIIADSSASDVKKADIVSTVVHNMTYSCIRARNSMLNIANSQITNSGDCCLDIDGGNVNVSFTTIADFPVWHTSRVAVCLKNVDGAFFEDCIITGRHKDEIELDEHLESDWEGRLGVSRSLVMTRDSLWGFFSDCLFENQKSGLTYGAANFVEIPRKYDRSFRLDSISRARGIAGNPARCPVDLDGNPRPAEHPDAGCYQYIESDRK